MTGELRPDPKLSVITVSYNEERTIASTLQSIADQTWTNVEMIVIDGASQDATVDRVEPFRARLAHFSSEKDKGLYDAMNKGLDAATGDYVCFMNAGDKFHHDRALESIIKAIGPTPKLLFGRAIVASEIGQHSNPPMDEDPFEWMGRGFPSHQASFYPASFARQNRYRMDRGSAADTDFTLRAIEAHGWRFVDDVICDFALGGVSNRFANWNEVQRLTADRWRVASDHTRAFKPLFLAKYLVGPIAGWSIKRLLGESALTKLRHSTDADETHAHKATR